jgi:hypothetical protein
VKAMQEVGIKKTTFYKLVREYEEDYIECMHNLRFPLHKKLFGKESLSGELIYTI